MAADSKPARESGSRRADLPLLRAPYAPPDEELAARFLAEAGREAAAEARIDARASRLIAAIRSRAGGVGGIEDFLHE
jgi:RHH-type proline utilization regulon transcriptional repressor/proline dehydrogenase/delta 1-pyrroline-5-carboxylate dehydrogenase